MTAPPVRRWVLHANGVFVRAEDDYHHCAACDEDCVAYSLAADYDALAKRVEELENQRDEADDALAFVRNERDRALAVVEAARKYVNDAGADIMELADALDAYDKEE